MGHTGSWQELEFPHYLSWVLPLGIVSLLIAIGRVSPPIDNTPAEIKQHAHNLRAHIENKNDAGALIEVEALLKHFPNNHVYLLQAAEMNLRLAKHLEVASLLERYMAVSPVPGEACPTLTHSYWSAGLPQQMLEAAARCLKSEPANSDFQFDFALAQERAGKLDEALAQYETGSRTFPTYGDFTIGRARVLLRRGHAEDAWAVITAYLETSPGVADAQLVAALAAERTDRKEKAREILDEARRNHPDNLELKSALEAMMKREGTP